MCGIWASFGLDPDRRALSPILRRGPDGQDALNIAMPGGCLALRFSRLAIYDLSAAGMQPMVRKKHESDPGLTIVFNGAIYNYVELRAELSARGDRFKTNSDTEVLLAAWDAWGPDALQKLEGMFAFALFDAREAALYVARDRFGEKPLHWAKVAQSDQVGLAFASDIRQLLPFLPQGARLNQAVMADYLNVGVLDRANATFFAGVERVPAGSFARIDLSHHHSQPPTFRDWRTPPRRSTYTADALREALQHAVKLRLKGDAPAGVSLSGGLDSSFVVACASREVDAITTVTVLFDEPELSEAAYFKAATDAFPTRPIIVRPSAEEAFEALPAVTLAQAEPFANTSVLSQWFLFKAARNAGLKIMLDGQGADELFGGYPGMAAYHLADLLTEGKVLAWEQMIRAMQKEDGDFSHLALRRQSFALALHARRQTHVHPAWLAPSHPYVESPLTPGSSRFQGLIHRLSFSTSLPGLLRYEDCNAMDHGVETRLPFLSTAMADCALTMPAALQFAGGWTKSILRDAATGLVPEMIVRRRRKLGFSSPMEQWMKEGQWRDWISAQLSAAGQVFGFVDRANLQSIQKSLDADDFDCARAFRVAQAVTWAHSFSVSA
jgi:asparagine synthase (glutamine-hydrolysing)